MKLKVRYQKMPEDFCALFRCVGEDTMKKVSTLLVGHLKKLDVTHVFGVPGKPVAPLSLELERQGIRYVLCRHECGAGFAATGYALMHKSLGVAIGTSGPGGMNLLTAAGQAKACNLPVLFLTGQPSIGQAGKVFGQDSTFFGSDLVRMFEPVTLFSARIERGEQLPLYFQHAVETAWRGRGPIHLNVPADVLKEEITSFEINFSQNSPLISSEIANVIPLLDRAESPVLFLGKEVYLADVYKEVKEIADRWNIPVITTPGGKGSFLSDDPLCLGAFGLGGSEEAELWLRRGVDLMIVIGDKVSDMSAAGLTPDLYPKQVIQFDYDPTFIGKSIPVPTTAIAGDIKANLQRLLEVSKDRCGTEYITRPIPKKQQTIATESKMLSAVQTMRLLRKHIPADAIVFGDAGSTTFYAVKYFDIYEPGTFYFDENFIAMGHGIGFSIGAKLAQPDRRVVCMTGDGCMFMHGAEVSTAVCNNVPVIFIVFNNGRLDMVDKGMKHHLGRSIGTVFETPIDATLFGRSLGAAAFCCRTERDIEEALQFALNCQGPTVVEIIVDPDEIPPILKRG
jgi:acetolactate synthase I/II/III large subunit